MLVGLYTLPYWSRFVLPTPPEQVYTYNPTRVGLCTQPHPGQVYTLYPTGTGLCKNPTGAGCTQPHPGQVNTHYPTGIDLYTQAHWGSSIWTTPPGQVCTHYPTGQDLHTSPTGTGLCTQPYRVRVVNTTTGLGLYTQPHGLGMYKKPHRVRFVHTTSPEEVYTQPHWSKYIPASRERSFQTPPGTVYPAYTPTNGLSMPLQEMCIQAPSGQIFPGTFGKAPPSPSGSGPSSILPPTGWSLSKSPPGKVSPTILLGSIYYSVSHKSSTPTGYLFLHGAPHDVRQVSTNFLSFISCHGEKSHNKVNK